MRTGRFVRNVLAPGMAPHAGDVVWRLQFDETRLAAACQSRTSGSSTVIVMDFDLEGRWPDANDRSEIDAGQQEMQAEAETTEVARISQIEDTVVAN